MDIFNPTVCLAKELSSSWVANVLTRKHSGKIPIDIFGGVPRLRMEYDDRSADDWFVGVLPLLKDWEPTDISEFSSLHFTLYSDESCGGLLRLEDSELLESKDFDLSDVSLKISEENYVTVPLNDAFYDGIDTKKARLLKFIGYTNSAFFISEIYLE